MKIKLIFFLCFSLMFFSCVSEDDISEEAILPVKEALKSVTYEVLSFEYIPDTGNNSSRLRYDIKFTNPNNVPIKGTSSITMDYDGIVLTPIKRVPPYVEIEANSSFTESFDVEQIFNPVEVKIKSIKLVSVKFNIAD